MSYCDAVSKAKISSPTSLVFSTARRSVLIGTALGYIEEIDLESAESIRRFGDCFSSPRTLEALQIDPELMLGRLHVLEDFLIAWNAQGTAILPKYLLYFGKRACMLVMFAFVNLSIRRLIVIGDMLIFSFGRQDPEVVQTIPFGRIESVAVFKSTICVLSNETFHTFQLDYERLRKMVQALVRLHFLPVTK